MEKIRQPIITVAGHVDHGKTSLLDYFRGSSVQAGEAGGITQKISFTKYPYDQIKKVCPLIDKAKIDLKIPGFLFIDTPGHAAFTNLRQRGGSLADIVILVVDIKEGIQPQTAEVIQILKANKTPFVVALNKVDKLSGWRKESTIKQSLESLPIHTRSEFEVSLGTFQASLQDHGFDADLFYDVPDFTKKIAIVPCSARTGEGIPELLLVLCGLSQKFLTEKLKLSEVAKGILLEVKKEKSMETAESILYDGALKEGDSIGIATLSGELIVTKIRSIEEVLPLSFKFKSEKSVLATTGIRMQLTNKEEILSGMPFEKIDNNEKEIREKFNKEFKNTLHTDKAGIIAKADSLGSLEALLTLLRQAHIPVVKADIGNIGKADIIAAKANLELNPLDSIILGFNVEKETDLQYDKNIKVLTNQVVYKLIEDLEAWRKEKAAAIEKERMMELASICKLEILHQFQFRNSNPAVFGVRVLAGKLKKNISLTDETGEEIARVKALQENKDSVESAEEGKELAISLPGTNFERQLADKKYLYSQLGESQFKAFKKNKDLLKETEIKALMEIAEIKRKKKSDWGK
jgi:translation initiation factor 5B